MNLFSNTLIIAELKRAWLESDPENPAGRHEEGGYIVVNQNNTLIIERWPRGTQFSMKPPPLDKNKCYNGNLVVAAFHTHPNPPIDELGQEWEQEPSASDLRWHRRRNLEGIVISWEYVFHLDTDGNVTRVGTREEVFLR